MKFGFLACLLWFASLASAGEGGRWEPLASMNLDRQETCAARIGDRVYVCGGLRAGFNATDTAEVYDITTDTWDLLPPMPAARDHAAAAALDGVLYVIGGFDGDFIGKADVYLFDPGTNQWSVGPSLPAPVGAAWAVTLGGKIYVFGGSFLVRSARRLFLNQVWGGVSGRR